MKLNLKIFGIILILTVMVISAASAVELAGNFSNEKFEMDVPSECNLSEKVHLNDGNTSILIFENTGNNSEDINSIIYIRDNELSNNNWGEDLQFIGDEIEKTDKYTLLKISDNAVGFKFEIRDDNEENDKYIGFKDSDNPFGFKFGFDSRILSDLFGNSISSFLNKLNLDDDISDIDGANISISEDGISISDNSNENNQTLNVSGDFDDYSKIKDSDYGILLKNTDNNEFIVILGDEQELLKSIAETTTFNEN